MNSTLHRILQKHLPTQAAKWLEGNLQALTADPRDRDFFLAYGACARHCGKDPLPLDEADRSALTVEYPNFGATSWSADELARVLLLTALPTDRNLALIDRLAGSADVRETIALYKGLYFLKNADDFVPRTREGLRTNMIGVFDAIALNNPYPARYLTEDAWNHMVLKAMFMDRSMYRIYRIEDRKNPKLADIFMDYAEERRSAHRSVSPELWRFVAGHVSDRSLPGLQLTITDGSDLERTAAAKAILESDYAPATDWLRQQDLPTDNLPSWNEIGRKATSPPETVPPTY